MTKQKSGTCVGSIVTRNGKLHSRTKCTMDTSLYTAMKGHPKEDKDKKGTSSSNMYFGVNMGGQKAVSYAKHIFEGGCKGKDRKEGKECAQKAKESYKKMGNAAKVDINKELKEFVRSSPSYPGKNKDNPMTWGN